jgi:hypothetical protein
MSTFEVRQFFTLSSDDRDGLKIRIITYAKDRQEIDFSTIMGDANYAGSGASRGIG